MYSQDVAARTQLERCAVLQYANQIQRGHKDWADTNPPSWQALQHTIDYLEECPDAFGREYLGILLEAYKARGEEIAQHALRLAKARIDHTELMSWLDDNVGDCI